MKICRSCGCGPCNHITVTVKGCNTKAMPGATVQLISSGTVVSSGTTDGFGNVSLGIPSAGTYTVSATAPAGAVGWSATPATTTLTLSCTGTPGTTLTLSPATGYSCRCSNCRDPVDTGTVATRQPSLTDANGTYALTWSSIRVGWICCYLLPGQTLFTVTGSLSCGTPTTTGNVAIGYVLTCPVANGAFALTQWFTACDPGPTTFRAVLGNCANPNDSPTAFPYDSSGGFKTNSSDTYNGPFVASATSAPNSCNNSLSFTLVQTYLPGTVAVTF